MTRVSVGLPVYNGERYLAEALDDLLAQTHRDLDIVISDNGSTDRTQQICAAYAARDPRIRYLRQDVNRGAAWNHNEVIRQALGPLFRWYSYDDRMGPDCIAACAAALDDDPQLLLAWPLTRVIDAAGTMTADYRDDLPFDNATPVSRLRSLLGGRTDETHLHMCYPVYGVVRLDTLLTTHLLGTMPAADTVLLCELALRGRWRLVRRRLFSNRRHVDSSAVDKSAEEISAWFDPLYDGVFPMPQTRLLGAYLRAVATAPVGLAQRLQCFAVVCAWFMSHRRWRIILGEIRIRAGQLGVERRGQLRTTPTRPGS